MHICIDGHNLAMPQGTGVATYARNLANTLRTMGNSVSVLFGAPISSNTSALLKEVSFYDYLANGSKPLPFLPDLKRYLSDAFRAPRGMTAYPIPDTAYVEKRVFQRRLPQQANILNADNLYVMARQYFSRHGRFMEIRLPPEIQVMHWTYPLPIKAAGIPNYYTIHDLIPLKLPYTNVYSRGSYYRLIRECIKASTRICTVSECSKADIELFYPEAKGKVVNTYQCSDMAAAEDNHARTFALAGRNPYGLVPGGYFLYFGAIEPKKNVGRLIEAYLQSGIETPLLIAGKKAWQADQELATYEALAKVDPQIKERIRLLGYVPEHLLAELLSSAKAVLFPSLYEGFGLPVLEAMQQGVPTLTSGEGALREVAANAAICVDPFSIESISEGIRAIDHSEATRHQLSLAGKVQASLFGASHYQSRLESLYL
ncbi:glycosyltransferase family 4 protein [Frateuria aurantia]|nr:glycosyltransferase family 1 protein [Frateuria aurantia]